MRPGQFSWQGFLGPTEKLMAVIEHDSKLLSGIHVTHEQLGNELDRLITLAVGSNRDMILHVQYEIHITRYKGFQLCPWSPDPTHGQCTFGMGVQNASIKWVIRNKRNKLEMKGPGLIVHLIRDHHFFEGLKSPYRVDPVELSRLLEISGP